MSQDDDDDDNAAKTESSEEDDDNNAVNDSKNNTVNDSDGDDDEVDKLAKAFQEQTKVTNDDAVSPKEEEIVGKNEHEAKTLSPPLPLPSDDDDDAPKDLKKVAEWIRSGQAKKILVVTGAGVSVAAGIPDFRSPGTGLYDNLKKYNLPYPEAVFDIQFYQKNPQPFIQLASELWPASSSSSLGGCAANKDDAKYKPTLTHCFLALLAEKELLLRVYTQNIDGLDHMGTYTSTTCVFLKPIYCNAGYFVVVVVVVPCFSAHFCFPFC
jgi:Sir2 family